MKESTRAKLTAEMTYMASWFSGSNTKFGYKQVYKAWQRQLNAYNDYFSVLAEVYPAKSEVAKERLAAYKDKLLETTRDLSAKARFIINRDKNQADKYGVFMTHTSASFVSFTKEITKVMIRWQAEQAKTAQIVKVASIVPVPSKAVVVAAKAKPIAAAKTKPVARTAAFGTRRINLDEPKKSAGKTKTKVVPDVPVQLTIGNKVVDLGPLLAIPAVKKYIEEQTRNVVKEANLAKAKELQAQIESLGFEVTLS